MRGGGGEGGRRGERYLFRFICLLNGSAEVKREVLEDAGV